MKNIMLYLIIFLSNTLYAQKSITVIVKDENSLPIYNASIILKEANNRIVANGTTDSAGVLFLPLKNLTSVTLEISHIGYILFQKIIYSSEIKITENIFLKTDITQLNGVTVVSNKPFVIMQPDRYILNIGGKTAIGNTVADILKKSPGISIANENITLEGKPVVVQVNGKIIPLSGKELLNYLSRNSALNINQIELITTPSSNMDAGFSDGVINLKMRKLQKAGFNGSLSGTLGHRSKHPNEDIGVNMNFRKGKINIFSAIDAYMDNQNSNMSTIRNFSYNNRTTKVDEKSKAAAISSGLFQSTGIDFQLTDKSIVGLLISSNINYTKNNVASTSAISNGDQLDSIQTMDFRTKRNSFINSINLNLKSNLDSAGQEINVDVDYDIIQSQNIGNQNFAYLLPALIEYKSRYFVSQTSDNSSKIFGIKIDYHKKFKKAMMDAGLKFANSQIKYNLTENRQIAGGGIVILTDTFNYNEKILAGYLSFSGKIKKWTFRCGIRGEYTNLSGKSFTLNQYFRNNYFNIFPTITLSKQLDVKNNFSFSFRKSISRPRFSQLNPFRYYTSPFFFYAGNPDLSPYYPYSVRIAYGYNNKIQASVSWSFAKNKITEISSLPDNSNVIQNMKANNGKYNTIYAGISHYDNITKWWYTNSTVNLVYSNFQFVTGTGVTKFNNTAFSFYSTQRFSLPKSFIIELYGYLTSATYYDASYSKPFWYLDFSVYKEILKGNGDVSFGIKDIFYSNVTRSVSRYANINSSLENRWDSREFNLSFSYKFGNKELKENRNRSNTATSEEKGRIN
jgi:Outer membrane protein beta-barrel family